MSQDFISYISKYLVFASLLISLNAFSQKSPKLVIGIVVDQMRQDYLFRFQDKMGDDGFRKLMRDGAYFKNAHYNYVPTYTAPGHASIYTGTTPSNHGIIGNDWFSRKSGLMTYCVSDTSVKAVGGSRRAGQMSPHKLQSTTITDELALTTNFKAKIVGVSIKDRGAILPAGHAANAAYWFESSTGNFISSTYYMEELPQWLIAFNNERKVQQYLNEKWETLLPINQYVHSTPDDVPYERAFQDSSKPTFPYDLRRLQKKKGPGLIRTTPFGNSLIVDLAIAALQGEQMGEDEVTDFLTVSFSSTDYVGHAFGPYSIELEDTYLRMDMEIARLLDFLDDYCASEYLVFLTADHGVAPVPLFLTDNQLPGGYSSSKAVRDMVETFLKKEYGDFDWVRNLSNDQIFLDHQLMVEQGVDVADMQQKIVNYLLTFPMISETYAASELRMRNANSRVKRLFENGFNSTLSGDIA
ncbi:MAG: alkaline phosphatase family protein, partial [Bacteroidota bacterium]